MWGRARNTGEALCENMILCFFFGCDYDGLALIFRAWGQKIEFLHPIRPSQDRSVSRHADSSRFLMCRMILSRNVKNLTNKSESKNVPWACVGPGLGIWVRARARRYRTEKIIVHVCATLLLSAKFSVSWLKTLSYLKI